MKYPKVNLINYTRDPIATMCWARRVMHSEVPDSLTEFKKDPDKYLGMSIDKYVDTFLLKDHMPTFLEYINVTFKLENVSRALQQQLTRHRVGFSFSIQSLRCVEVPKFAQKGAYHNPLMYNEKKATKYHEAMLKIQNEYNKLLNAGVTPQDARGILPMNIHSTITFSCTLRALIGMINKRLCNKTQEEFRVVADLIVKEIHDKMPPVIQWFGRPCAFGKCMMEAENEQQYKEGKLKGKQNTDHCCEIYQVSKNGRAD